MTSSRSPDLSLPFPDPELAGAAFNALDITAGGSPVLGLAVSGGSDSLSLLFLAVAWGRARGRGVRAATVDHGLRPEAALEARGVGEICARLGINHDILTWAPGKGPVSQALARQARYRLLSEWAHAHRIEALALGHTQDDRIETFLIRLRAGSTWYGLAGPMPSAPCPLWREGESIRLIRPLLAFGREELRGALRHLGEVWVEDPSNTSRRHERVRMRALAGALAGASRSSLIRQMNRLADMRSAVCAEARNVLERHVTVGEAEALLEASPFRGMSLQGSVRLAEALILAMGESGAPLRHEALLRLIAQLRTPGGVGRGRTLSGAWLSERRGFVRIRAAPPRRGSDLSRMVPSLRRAGDLLTDPLKSTLYVRLMSRDASPTTFRHASLPETAELA